MFYRYYDMAKSHSTEAVVPVTLALLKLSFHTKLEVHHPAIAEVVELLQVRQQRGYISSPKSNPKNSNPKL